MQPSRRPASPPATAQAIVDDNASSRINGLRAALAVLALIALVALALTRRLPDRSQPEDGDGASSRPGEPTTSAEPPSEAAQARRRVTLHQARLRHEGQVMRWSKRPRGSQ